MTESEYQQFVMRQNAKKLGDVPTEHEAYDGPESDLHDEIIDFCRSRGWIYLHGSMAERSHRTLGEPDFVIAADNGRTFYIEVKNKNGKMSPEQLSMMAHLLKLGHTHATVRSMAEFMEVVK